MGPKGDQNNPQYLPTSIFNLVFIRYLLSYQLFGVVRVQHDARVALDEVPVDACRVRQQLVQLLRLSTTKHPYIFVDRVYHDAGQIADIFHIALIYVSLYLPHQIYGFSASLIS